MKKSNHGVVFELDDDNLQGLRIPFNSEASSHRRYFL